MRKKFGITFKLNQKDALLFERRKQFTEFIKHKIAIKKINTFKKGSFLKER